MDKIYGIVYTILSKESWHLVSISRSTSCGHDVPSFLDVFVTEDGDLFRRRISTNLATPHDADVESVALRRDRRSAR